MRIWLLLLLPLFLLFCATDALATTTSGATVRNVDVSDGIVITGGPAGSNGTNWEMDEVYAGFGGIINWYLTWDETNLYIGKIGGNNAEGAMLYLRADFTGASHSNTPQPYDGYTPDLSAMGGINFGAYLKDTYDEFRTWNGATWSAADITLTPTFTNTGGDDHFEVAIPWNSITAGNGKPDNLRAVMYQVAGAVGGCGANPIYAESPWGDGTGGSPTVGVNDGTPTSASQPGGCVGATPSITRWWGCYPVIGDVSSNGWAAQQPDAGTDTLLCQDQASDTIAVSANDPAADAVGTWQFVMASLPLGAATPQIDNVNDSATVFRDLDGFGTYEFVWSINYGMCPSTPDTLKITRVEAPDVANAGLNDTLACDEDLTTLDANDPNIGIGVWTAPFSGGIQFDDDEAYDSEVEDLDFGTNVLVWTITNDPSCPASIDTVIIYAVEDPSASAGTNTTVCADTMQLSGNDPLSIAVTVTGEWTQVLGPTTVTFDDSSQYNTVVRGMTTAGEYRFMWTLTHRDCTPATDIVIVTVANAATANAGPTQDICAMPTATLAGNDPATIGPSVTGEWKQVSGPNSASFTDNTLFNTTATGLVAGSYVFRWVLDNAPCPSDSDEVSINIYTQPAASAGTDQELCGSATASTLSGNNPVLIQSTALASWNVYSSPGVPTLTANQFNTAISALQTGVYDIEWIVTNGNCTPARDTVLLNVDNGPAPSEVVTGASCGSASDGIIDLSVTSGTSPYTYIWSTGSTAQDIVGLPVGTYTVTITDASGCILAHQVAVGAGAGAMAISSTTVSASCATGADASIDLSVSGGSMPYTYAWNTAATTEDLSNLTSNTYTVTVTDGGGCTLSDNIAVGAGNLSLAITVAQTDAQCANTADGTIGLTVSNGTLPHSYSWSNSGTTASITGLAVGTYTATVTDASGCVGNAVVAVGQPAPLSATLIGVNATCAGAPLGSISATVMGGTGAYSYAWSNGDTIAAPDSLLAGNYFVTFSDANGCTLLDTLEILEPTAVVATATSTDATCPGIADGTAMATAAGGITPYSFGWSNGDNTAALTNIGGGTYTITVADFNGCIGTATTTVLEPGTFSLGGSTVNVLCTGDSTASIDLSVAGGTMPYTYVWNTGDLTEDLAGIPAGSYTCGVVDAAGCTDTINIGVTEPANALTMSISTDTTLCIGQSTDIMASASGGTGSVYTYTWNNGLVGPGPHTVNPSSLTCYIATVADTVGCTAGPDTVCVDQHPPLQVQVSNDTTVCNGAAVTISAAGSGGSGLLYLYSWSNGFPGPIQIVNPTGSASTTDYIVTVDDFCSPTITDTVTISFSTNPNLNIALSDTAGCAPQSILFNNTGTTGATCTWEVEPGVFIADCDTFSYTYLNEGTYPIQLVVEDAQGCADSTTAQIVMGTAPVVEFEYEIFPTCEGIEIDFTGTTQNATTNLWTFNGTDTDTNTTVTYAFDYSAGMEAVLEANNGFCSDTAQFSRAAGSFTDEFDLVIPNVFTPNSDGLNDFFEIQFNNRYQDCTQLQIVSRWGELMFTSLGATHYWDGRKFSGNPAAEGTYFYIFVIGEMEFKGTLTLMR